MKTYEVTVEDDGTKKWYLNGVPHREDGPAVESPYGNKIWFLNGKLHREDGQAIELTDGTKEWWILNERHREDGPAVERGDGRKWWYINGRSLTKEEFNALRAGKSEAKYIIIKNVVYLDDCELPQPVAACITDEYATKICAFLNQTHIENPYAIFGQPGQFYKIL